MYKKENTPPADNEEPLIEEEKRKEIDITDSSIPEELRQIYSQEKYHFTMKRVMFILINLSILIVVQCIYKNKNFSKEIRYATAIVFAILMILMTMYSVREVNEI